MPTITFRSIVEQVAEHLRAEILRGRWRGTMPGKHQLAAELGVNNKTVEGALRMLEHTGLLAPQGAGRRRLIVLRGDRTVLRPLRVALLINDASDRSATPVVDLRHGLEEAGHTVILPAKSMTDLDFEVKRVARLVKQTVADAWLVVAGSREVLEWFVAQAVPAFALSGNRRELPLAGDGADMLPAMRSATQALLDLGHRRIVLLTRKIQRLPSPAPVPQAFLACLEATGIHTSTYNLPDWEESREGFQRLLTELLRITPPSAMIIDEPTLFTPAQQFLARRRIRVPEDISMICVDSDPTFAWCVPSITHLRWDFRPAIRRIVRWASNVSRGRRDIRQRFQPAEFVAGGTIGPAPAASQR